MGGAGDNFIFYWFGEMPLKCLAWFHTGDRNCKDDEGTAVPNHLLQERGFPNPKYPWIQQHPNCCRSDLRENAVVLKSPQSWLE